MGYFSLSLKNRYMNKKRTCYSYNMEKLTRKQIFEKRGELKARPRAEAVRSRYKRQLITYERKYQENLAREILRHI